MCFKQDGAISNLSDKLLKLVDQFMFFCSNNEVNVDRRIWKVWTAVEWLSIIRKINLLD